MLPTGFQRQNSIDLVKGDIRLKGTDLNVYSRNGFSATRLVMQLVTQSNTVMVIIIIHTITISYITKLEL